MFYIVLRGNKKDYCPICSLFEKYMFHFIYLFKICIHMYPENPFIQSLVFSGERQSWF